MKPIRQLEDKLLLPFMSKLLLKEVAPPLHVRLNDDIVTVEWIVVTFYRSHDACILIVNVIIREGNHSDGLH